MWRVLSVIGLGLGLGMVGSGCFSDTGGGESGGCTLGTEGCPCTPGGSCDPGLECRSDLCVAADETGEGESGEATGTSDTGETDTGESGTDTSTTDPTDSETNPTDTGTTSPDGCGDGVLDPASEECDPAAQMPYNVDCSDTCRVIGQGCHPLFPHIRCTMAETCIPDSGGGNMWKCVPHGGKEPGESCADPAECRPAALCVMGNPNCMGGTSCCEQLCDVGGMVGPPCMNCMSLDAGNLPPGFAYLGACVP